MYTKLLQNLMQNNPNFYFRWLSKSVFSSILNEDITTLDKKRVLT